MKYVIIETIMVEQTRQGPQPVCRQHVGCFAEFLSHKRVAEGMKLSIMRDFRFAGNKDAKVMMYSAGFFNMTTYPGEPPKINVSPAKSESLDMGPKKGDELLIWAALTDRKHDGHAT